MIPFVVLAIENEDDRNFMADIYLRYEGLMMSVILKTLKSASCEVQDVFQNLLVKLIRNVDKLRSMDDRSMANYLYTAALNTCRDELRKLKRAKIRSIDDETWFDHDKLVSNDDTLELVFRREDMRMLNEALDLLDARSAYLIRAKYLLDTDNNEMARHLEIKPDSVRMELSRARKKLKTIMAEKASVTDA